MVVKQDKKLHENCAREKSCA